MLSREPKWAQPGNGPVVTTFVFRVRNVPAALYKALGGFATNGVNMTKLESYMIERQLLRDAVLCRRRGPSRRPQRSSLRWRSSPSSRSEELKILGVYPAHPFRKKF